MTYIVNVSNISKVQPVAGWFVVLPFSFKDETGEVVAKWRHLLAAVHLATPRENSKDDFRTVSNAGLARTNNLTFKPEEPVHDEALEATSVELKDCWACQTIAESQTLWALRGVGAGTKLKWKPPAASFKEWGSGNNELHGWEGQLSESSSKLSFTRVNWNGSYFTSVDFAGPCGENGMGGLFNKMLGCCSPFTDRETAGQLGPGLTLKDGNRKERGLQLMGNGDEGIAQVDGASGAIWLAQGSFARRTAADLVAFARHAHSGAVDLSGHLGREPLADTKRLDPLEIGGDRPAAKAMEAAQLGVFEGFSLWGLKRRSTTTAAPPVLL